MYVFITVCVWMVPVLCDRSKVFVGEVVEEACLARDKMKDEGPLQPKHIREAVRVLKNRDKLPNCKYKKVFRFS